MPVLFGLQSNVAKQGFSCRGGGRYQVLREGDKERNMGEGTKRDNQILREWGQREICEKEQKGIINIKRGGQRETYVRRNKKNERERRNNNNN